MSSRRSNDEGGQEVARSTAGATRPDDLEKWLAFLGAHCRCEYAWKGLGTLYGVSMGKGWVRMTDAPNCPEHGE